MLEDIAEFLRPREERVEVSGRTLVVKEKAFASDLGLGKEDPDRLYRLMIACVFLEDGTPALTDDDIPLLRAGGHRKVGKLVEAVLRVNGLDDEAEAKKSSTDPA